MLVQILHRHVRDTVIILEEGNLPHPRCPKCNMLVPWKALNRRHITITRCAKGVEWKRQCLAEEEIYQDDYLFQIPGAGFDGVR